MSYSKADLSLSFVAPTIYLYRLLLISHFNVQKMGQTKLDQAAYGILYKHAIGNSTEREEEEKGICQMLPLDRLTSLQTGFLRNKMLAVDRVYEFSTHRANVHTFVFGHIPPIPTLRGKLQCVSLRVLL
mmetsp:Transcript_31130/g.71738  ORF Transcript_31130/g.71738 Transcript_31130/m.71738 type:complete len:129 (-) Transcript_31130:587-973(-)